MKSSLRRILRTSEENGEVEKKKVHRSAVPTLLHLSLHFLPLFFGEMLFCPFHVFVGSCSVEHGSLVGTIGSQGSTSVRTDPMRPFATRNERGRVQPLSLLFSFYFRPLLGLISISPGPMKPWSTFLFVSTKHVVMARKRVSREGGSFAFSDSN